MQLKIIFTLLLLCPVAQADINEFTKELGSYQGLYKLTHSSSDECPSLVDLRLEKTNDYWVLQSGGSFFLRALGSSKKWQERDCKFSARTDWVPGSKKSAVISTETIRCKGKPAKVFVKTLEMRQEAISISVTSTLPGPNRKVASLGVSVRDEKSSELMECSLDFLGPPKDLRKDLVVKPKE